MITACSLCAAIGEAKVEEVIFIVYGLSVCPKHIEHAGYYLGDYIKAAYHLREEKKADNK